MSKSGNFYLSVWMVSMIPSLNGCMQPTEPKAKLNSYLDSSFSCDLKSSGDASKNASDAAFRCAYDAMGQAASLSSGVGLAHDVKEFIDGINDIKQVISGSYQIILDMKEFFESGGQASDGMLSNALDTLDSEKRLDPITKKSAIYRCLSGNYNVMKKFYKVMATAEKAANSRDSIQSDDFMALVSMGTDISELIYSGISNSSEGLVASLGGCSEWMNDDPKFKVALKEGIDAMKKVMTPIKNLRVLAQCGVSLAVGGYVLANNSACLVEDIQNYYKSLESLERQKDNYVNTATESEASCMTKYGIWLYRQNFYGYVTRLGACADLCATTNGKKLYYENGRKIFPVESDYDYCTMNAHVGRSSIGVEYCASYCCGQDGRECQDAALKKAGFSQ